jgi:hypothetical protein
MAYYRSSHVSELNHQTNNGFIKKNLKNKSMFF